MKSTTNKHPAAKGKRRIVLVNKFYDPVIGGVETVVKQYAEFLSERYQVVVLTAHRSLKLRTSRENSNGILVIRCSSFGTVMAMPMSPSLIVNFLALRRRASVIHFHEPFPLASLLSLVPKGRRKYIVTWHSDIVRQRVARQIVGIFQRRLCSMADCVTTTSPSLFRYSIVLPRLKVPVKIVPLSIALDEFDGNGTRPRAMPTNSEYALFLGRLSYYKGVEVLIEAHRILQGEVPLLIVGSGELSPIVRARLGESDCSNLWFIDHHLSSREKLYVLRNCRFLVFPSTVNSEAFGIIQLEAMACSKPVINTDLKTGVPWVSQDSVTGITVPAKSPKHLANAMLKLWQDEALAKRYGLAGRERVETKFSNTYASRMIMDIYRNYEE